MCAGFRPKFNRAHRTLHQNTHSIMREGFLKSIFLFLKQLGEKGFLSFTHYENDVHDPHDCANERFE